MIELILLAQAEVQPTVPATPAWNWQETLVIGVCCLLLLLIFPRTIRYPQVGPKMPLGPFEGIFNSPSVATFLAAMAAGHILGVGIILGLTNLANP